MLLSGNDIIKIIKQAAIEAVQEADPASVVYGTIAEADTETGEVALVKVDQQWEINGGQLVVPRTYKERTIEQIKVKGSCIAQLHAVLDKLEISYELDEDCEADEALVDVTIKDFLKEGDAVIITRQQGGQRFVITGRTNNE